MRRIATFGALVLAALICWWLGVPVEAAAAHGLSPGAAAPTATSPPAKLTGLGLSQSAPWKVTQAAGRGAVSGFLDDVSCPVPGHCSAVGSQRSARGALYPLVEMQPGQPGGAWQKAALPVPAGRASASLLSVACPSTSSCVAVGFSASADGDTFPLIEVLSGGKWSPTTAPARPDGASASLSGVACVDVGRCVAVGWEGDNIPSPWAVQLKNGGWTVLSSPALSQTQGAFNSVSCQTTGCLAVGNAFTDIGLTTLEATWHAGAWSVGRHSLVGTDAYAPGLTSVSCRPARCVSVGELGNQEAPLLLTGKGTAFSQYALPAPRPGEAATGLWGVSCPVTGQCTAVGALSRSNVHDFYAGALPDPQGLLIERQSGTGWRGEVVPTGLPAQSGLHGISCVDGVCVAVGMTGQATTDQPFTASTLILQN